MQDSQQYDGIFPSSGSSSTVQVYSQPNDSNTPFPPDDQFGDFRAENGNPQLYEETQAFAVSSDYQTVYKKSCSYQVGAFYAWRVKKELTELAGHVYNIANSYDDDMRNAALAEAQLHRKYELMLKLQKGVIQMMAHCITPSI